MKFKQLKGPYNGPALIIAFDICSSSAILETLSVNDDLGRYERLLGKVKRYLAKQQGERFFFDPYRFTGDGWILLTPTSMAPDGATLMAFLRDLSQFFQREFRELKSHLDIVPKVTGINFGLDVGRVHYMTMYQRPEWIGRPINIACRLQGAIKDKDKAPAYKALVTRAVYNTYLKGVKGLPAKPVQRTLRNIRDEKPFRCVKIKLI